MTVFRCGGRHLTSAFVVGVVGALILASAPESSEASSATGARATFPRYYNVDIRAHQFNMCDIACSNTGNPRDLVLWFNNDTGSFGSPWAIALNEACVANVGWLATQTGKQAFFATAKYVSACPGTDDRFGNAVLIGGSLLTGTNLQWQFPTQEQSPCTVSYSQECRKMVCTTFSSYAGNVTYCSGHLENNTSVATAQANEYIYTANSTYPGGRWLSGDFNLRTSEIPGVYYDQYYRSPQMYTFKSDSLDRQIDYIWHDRANSAFNTVGNRYCDINYSDHCMTFAKFG
jgi:hypothetical protein